MFTTIDKALTAGVMAAIFIANYFFGTKITANPDLVAAIVAGATPLLVYFVPNKKGA